MPRRSIKVIKQVTGRPAVDQVDSTVPHDVDNGMIRAVVKDWVDKRRENGRRERRVSAAAIAAWKVPLPILNPDRKPAR